MRCLSRIALRFDGVNARRAALESVGQKLRSPKRNYYDDERNDHILPCAQVRRRLERAAVIYRYSRIGAPRLVVGAELSH